jgi:hypothetical protein
LSPANGLAEGVAYMSSDEPAEPVIEKVMSSSEPYSTHWWRACSSENLRDIIARGPSVGAIFDSAVAETERRARECREREEQAAAAQSLRKARVRRVMLEGLLLVCLTLLVVAMRYR